MDLEICSSSLPLVFSSSVNGNSGEESPTGSPVMWRPGSTHFKYCHSPMSCRAQEIAKGRQELLKLMEGMPESAYELSLSDLVETRETARTSLHEDNQNPNQEEQKQQENTNNAQKCFPQQQQKQQVKEKGKPHGMSKISSKSWKPNAPKNQVLLNIFVPKSIAYGSIPSCHKSSKPASPVASPCAKRIDSNNSIGSRLKSAVHSLLKLMRIKRGLFSSYGTSGFSKVSPKPISGKDNNKSEKFLPSAAAPSATEGFPIAANEIESDANCDSKRHLLSRAASYFSRTSSRKDCRGSCKSIKRDSKDADIISFHGNRRPELRRSRGCIPCLNDRFSH